MSTVTDIMRIPAPSATSVEMRFASLLERDRFDPPSWRRAPLTRISNRTGWWSIDPDALGLEDGDYEYEFILDGRSEFGIPDPFAEEIVRFGGYRGLFRIRGGRRWQLPFRWDDELPTGVRLPNNNEIVIYEMPLRWMDTGGESFRQIDLGTFEDAIFRHLDDLVDLGVNTIELLPIQDSPDTLNWGYGTRFFFAPDLDMGGPVDVKLFVKRCHQHGIRVFLDVVMNHARDCPLAALADDWYFLKSPAEEPGRGSDYGARMFRYRRPAPGGSYPAREFHFAAAAHWIEHYRIDGFRIDEFQGIDNWEFIQQFRDHAWDVFRRLFPDRPFLVVAEDSWRRAVATQDASGNPNGRKVVDAIWNFAYRDEVRRLVRDAVGTVWGQPSRRERIRAAVSGQALWDDLKHRLEPGFGDMAQAVDYLTSHDVQQPEEARLMNFVFGQMLRERGLGDGSVGQVRDLTDAIASQSSQVQQAYLQALDRVRGAFGLLMTSVGIPMFLAGEEFADVHDLEHTDWRLKMSDPINWERRSQPGRSALRSAVRDLIRLRVSHAALQRDEIEFFYFHPSIDDNGGVRVFAYARTGGQSLGSPGQVAVVANCGPHDFAEFVLPWPWTSAGRVTERGMPAQGAGIQPRLLQASASLSLAPFQVRVFAIE